MFRAFVLSIGLLVLASCGLTAADVYKVRASYDAAVLTPAAHYRAQCDAARTATCVAIVRKLQTADQAANIAIANAVAYVRANPSGNATSYVNIAVSAVNSAIAIAALYGVH